MLMPPKVAELLEMFKLDPACVEIAPPKVNKPAAVLDKFLAVAPEARFKVTFTAWLAAD
jgi:hypothetical protein